MATQSNKTVAASLPVILLSVDLIKSAQDGIRKSLIKLDQQIHDNAVQCLLHAETHGDTSLMRRLLVEIVDAKSGYRRQGLINWMRKHSPMELKADTINLSGTIANAAQVSAMIKMFPDADPKLFVVGQKRPFLVDYANKTPFASDSANAEKVNAVYTATAIGKIDAMYKEIMAAAENTVNGQPIDASKKFFDGRNMDVLVDFAKKVKEMKDALPKDNTLEIRQRQSRVAEDLDFIKGAEAEQAPKETVAA